MRIATVLTATALVSLAGLVTSAPALAQDDACARPYQIEQTRVLDRSTIVLRDRRNNEYTLHMAGTCVGLDRFSEQLTFRNEMRGRCLSHGDIIDYSFPGQPNVVGGRGAVSLRRGLGNQLSCTIDHVTAGAPVDPEDAAS